MAIARWKDLCIDATDAGRLGTFWATVLGRELEAWEDDPDRALRGARPEETIWVNTVPEPKTVKHRVHLDVEVGSIDPLVEAGATVLLPASESGFPWTVLADPEGGEFCAFVRDDRPDQLPARLYELAVDVADRDTSHQLADWWAEVLGARAVEDGRDFWWIEDVPHLPFDTIDFGPVPEPKTVKNRIHWDVVGDVDAFVERGATVLALPTDDTRWTVMADPAGNEFCVFAAE